MAAASIVIDLLMKTGSFETDTKRAAKELDRLVKQAVNVGKAVGTAFVVAGTAASAFVKSAIDAADASIKAAQGAGLVVEEFTALAFAANLSGTNSEQLGAALARLSRNAADAVGGNRELAAAFDAIGVSVVGADGAIRRTDDLLGDIAEQFAGYADGAEKTALAQELFGRSGAALIPLLNAGRDGIQALKEEAAALGIVVGTDVAKASEQFNDNISRLSAAADGLGLDLAERALPALVDVTNLFVDFAKRGGEAGASVSLLGAAFDGVVALFKGAGIVVSTVGFVLKVIGLEAGAAAAQLGILFRLVRAGPFSNNAEARSLREQFKFISQAVREDTQAARRELDEFQSRLLAAGRSPQAPAAPQPAAPQTALPPAPRVGDSEARLKAAEEATKRQEQAERRLTDEIKRQAEERQRALDQFNAGVAAQIDAVESQIAAFGTEGEQQAVFSLRLAGADPEALARLDSAVKELARLRAERQRGIKVAEDARAAEEALKAVYEANKTPIEELATELERLDRLRLVPGANQEFIDRAAFAALERADAALKGINEELPKTKSIAEEIGLSFTSAFESAVLGGQKLRDVFQSLARDLAQLALRRLITEPLLSAVSASFPARADGGPVLAGTTYLVGERGPELFTPTTTGSITSNNRLAGMVGGSAGGNIIIQNYGAEVQTRRESNGDTAIIVRAAANAAYGRVVADLASGSGRASAALRSRGVGMDNGLPRRS